LASVRTYHRLENEHTQTPEIAKLQEKSMEIWVLPLTNINQSHIPKVKAFNGSLPVSERGIEFTTDVEPDLGSPPGRSYWSGPREGVRVEEKEDGRIYAIIEVLDIINCQQ
jgi:hypothetical protein